MSSLVGVTGYKGRLGSALIELGCTPIPFDTASQLSNLLSKSNFDIIINCAAITDVDKCEENTLDCYLGNTIEVKILRDLFDGKIIHLSTDFIFDGKFGPYTEYSSLPSPINKYGDAKAEAEKYLNVDDTIIRTTILYSKLKNDFVGRVLDRIEFGNNFFVVDNMYGNPTYVPHLANAIKWMIEHNVLPHVVNIAGKEVISRFEFAKMIAQTFGYDDKIVLAKPYEWIEGTAKRPLKAGLVTDLAESLGIPIFSVQQGLDELKKEIK